MKNYILFSWTSSFFILHNLWKFNTCILFLPFICSHSGTQKLSEGNNTWFIFKPLSHLITSIVMLSANKWHDCTKLTTELFKIRGKKVFEVLMYNLREGTLICLYINFHNKTCMLYILPERFGFLIPELLYFLNYYSELGDCKYLQITSWNYSACKMLHIYQGTNLYSNGVWNVKYIMSLTSEETQREAK